MFPENFYNENSLTVNLSGRVGLSVVHDDAKHLINRCPVDNRFPRPTENVKAACTDLSCGF